MTTILSASSVVAARTELLADKVLKLRAKGFIPKLRVILAGANPASLVYIGHKKKMCQRLGCEF
ncbi:MAG: tetrahydrofolate dehydrogenase/cyclohydrolase catalytic domain-containing protein, partial [Bacteriovoracaceae bacterium]